MPGLRDMKSPISSTAAKWRRIVLSVSIYSECLGTTITWLSWELPVDSVIDRVLQSLPPSYKSFVMNYNMQGITETTPKLFVMLKSTKVEIKKNIKCWWLTRPLVSRKGQRERKGTSSRMTSKLSLPRRSPKLDQSMKLSAYTAKEMVTRSGNALNIWWIRRMAKWTRVYLIYRLLMCALLVFIVAPEYLILVRLLRLVTRNRSYRINRD